MSLLELNLKKGYQSGEDDILNDFYIPTLSKAVQYDRIAGYFSSRSLSVAARGIAGLIKNKGRMRLLTSPELTAEDYQKIEEYLSDPQKATENILLNSVFDLEILLQKDHLSAMCWMLENNRLEIKIAIPRSEDFSTNYGLFHMKTGILKDVEGNIVAFSGSINETAAAWTANKEEFKVFEQSAFASNEYCSMDVERFDKLWSNKRDDIQVYDLPVSVKQKLLTYAAKDIDLVLNRLSNNPEQISTEKETPYQRLSLFENQESAVTKWFDKGMRGVFAMATGTGKTRTAIGCITKSIERDLISLCIIAAPQNTILQQWINEIERTKLPNFQYTVADSSNSNWRNEISMALLQLTLDREQTHFVFTTHRTVSTNSFINIIKTKNSSIKTFFICDEVHGIGSLKSRKALLPEYDYRLGLSATPQRWFDDKGSQLILEYFNGIIYSFPISEALEEINPLTSKPYLCRYNYHPVFVSLTEEEVEEYMKLTQKLMSKMKKGEDEIDEKTHELLLFKRADIYKKASDKLNALRKLTDKVDIRNSIIFTCDKQIQEVKNILTEKGITFHSFTEKQGTKKERQYGNISEREHIIQLFVEKQISSLISIKCLDEGIDIPSADKAIIMTSGTNPREYIQRLGRVIRQHESKEIANIYDFIVVPGKRIKDSRFAEVEKKIFRKEVERAMEIAENSSNSINVVKLLYGKMEV